MSEGPVKEKYIPRLFKQYRETGIGHLKEKLSFDNVMEIPCLTKIVINMGLGQATSDAKIIEKAAKDLATITGQKVKVTRARKAISNFKIREKMAIGCCVTLRKARMYEFLDRFITVAVPRIRDFRGFSSRSFDGAGNYTFGIVDQTIFPEIDIDKVEKTLGMNITICTTSPDDEGALALLKELGFPFKK